MPSPLAHLATGYTLYRLLRESAPVAISDGTLLTVSAGYSLLPDFDALLGSSRKNMLRYHNNVSHSLPFVSLSALLGAVGFRLWRGHGFGAVLRAALLASVAHLVLDFWSTQRGLLLFWPFMKRRVRAPVKLFYGLKWGRGLWDKVHLWTLINELLYVTALAGFLVAWTRAGSRRQQSPAGSARR